MHQCHGVSSDLLHVPGTGHRRRQDNQQVLQRTTLAMDHWQMCRWSNSRQRLRRVDNKAAGDIKDRLFDWASLRSEARRCTAYPGSFSLYSSVPTVLTSVSVMRMDVNAVVSTEAI